MKRSSILVLVSGLALLGAGCRQDMHNQPRAKPQSKSGFFADGRTGRLPVEGTVARGHLREDDHRYRGKNADGTFATSFPIAIDAAVLARGRERYEIFCSPCHGRTGTGNGMVIQRGFKTAATSHHDQRLREAPVGYWFDVITNGFGVMFGYATQVPVNDRWAIVAYVRALQLSRNATEADVPEAQREALLAGGTVPAGSDGPHVAPAAESHSVTPEASH